MSLPRKAVGFPKASLPGDYLEWKPLIASVIRTGLWNRVEIRARIIERDVIMDCYLIPFYPQKPNDFHLLIDIQDITAIKTDGKSLWEDEETLQEMGRRVSGLLPTLKEAGFPP